MKQLRFKFVGLPCLRHLTLGASALALLCTLPGCATASSTRSQLYAQTQQNRALLGIEKQRTRDLTANRAALQRQLDERNQQRNTLQTQDDTPKTREEIRQINAEIAKLKQAILKSSE